jgi:tRNA(fMet)-specific endonuclease VapC
MFEEPVSSIGVPTLVLYELETGIAKSSDRAKRRNQRDTLLEVVRILPFGREEAVAAADIRAKLELAGCPIGPVDTLIAGVALARRGILVTRNLREFRRVEGLVVEDWYGA